MIKIAGQDVKVLYLCWNKKCISELQMTQRKQQSASMALFILSKVLNVQSIANLPGQHVTHKSVKTTKTYFVNVAMGAIWTNVTTTRKYMMMDVNVTLKCGPFEISLVHFCICDSLKKMCFSWSKDFNLSVYFFDPRSKQKF